MINSNVSITLITNYTFSKIIIFYTFFSSSKLMSTMGIVFCVLVIKDFVIKYNHKN